MSIEAMEGGLHILASSPGVTGVRLPWKER